MMILCLLFWGAAAYHPSTQYCAVVNPKTAGGAAGYFALTIDEAKGVSYYNSAVDLSLFKTTCATSEGIKYHIHSYWTNSSVFSSSGSTYCGASFTGGHYDPYLGCSSTSQYASSPPLCGRAYRNSTYGYTYNCSSASFGSKSGSVTGYEPSCEVGDLSGKFGMANTTVPGGVANLYTLPGGASALLVDPLPPSVSDYLRAVPSTKYGSYYTASFASIVWHCNDPPSNTRLFCAKLTTDTAPCLAAGAVYASSSSSPPSSSSKSYSESDFAAAVAGASIACLLVGVAAGTIISRWQASKLKLRVDDTTSNPLLSNQIPKM